MNKLFAVICCVLGLQAFAQTSQEFHPPLNIPLYLSGTFAELRGNHFHGGLDIKTNGKEGYRIYASQAGFISRIKVSAGGYGNALYVEHPSGYTTVYGHLSSFNDAIGTYVKNQQYAKQSFEVDLYLAPNQMPVAKGDVIALSGNSGSSGGPHLHYEIRKTSGQIPINPLKYVDIKDDINPTIYKLRVHDLANGFYNSAGKTYDVNYDSPGNYSLSTPVTTNASVIGISVKAIDKLNGSNNSNGFYKLSLYADDQLQYQYEKSEVSFSETRMLNAHVDYPEKVRGGGTYTNCFKLPGNQLQFLANSPYNDGRIWLNSFPNRKLKLVIEDFKGNSSVLNFNVNQSGTADQKLVEGRHFSANQTNYLSEDGVRLTIPSGALYDDINFDFKQLPTIESEYPVYSNCYQIHSEQVPLQQYMTVEVKQTNFPAELRSKAVMANRDAKGRIDVNTGSWLGDYFQVKTRNFGQFFITADTTKPNITVYRQPANNNYNGHNTIEFKISDDLSGVKDYRALVDGNWILMEYDRKRNLLYHQFDERIAAGNHQLKLTVTDYVGNTAELDLNFTR